MLNGAQACNGQGGLWCACRAEADVVYKKRSQKRAGRGGYWRWKDEETGRNGAEEPRAKGNDTRPKVASTCFSCAA